MMCIFGLFGSLNAQETTFFYDFEDGTLNGWNVHHTYGASAPDWAIGSGAYYGGQGDSYGVYSMSYGSSSYVAKNYLVTASKYHVTESSVVSWWVKHTYPGYETNDPYQMIVSEDGTTFTALWDGYYNQGENEKEVRFADHPEYAGKDLYIGFYHYGFNGDAIVLDNIALTVGEGGGETPDPTPDPEPENPGQDENNVVVIGEGASTSNQNRVPVNTNQAKSLSQQIYTATEINHAAGEISNLGFNVVMGNTTRQWAVYMANTDKEAFSSATDWVYGAEKVFDGEVSLPMSGWIDIEFNNNFNYTGKNIVLMVYDYTSGTISGPKFTNDNNANYVALTTFNVSDVNTLGIGTQRNCKNQIQLTFVGEGGDDTPDPTPTAPAAPQNLVATVNGQNSITLTWDAVEDVTSYEVYKDGAMCGIVGEAEFTATGLEAGTEYCFTVKALNDELASELSEQICATTEAEQGGDEPGGVCKVIFSLVDSYGDGWNGAYLNVTYNDVTVKMENTSANKKDPAIYELEISQGTHVAVEFVSGGYNVECSYTVMYESGEEIYSVAKNYAVASTYEFDVDCSPKIPVAPVVKAVAINESQIALTWNTLSTSSYNVYQGTDMIAEGLTETSYIVEGLASTTEYCFTVTAVNEVGESEASEEACATTLSEGAVMIAIGEGTIDQTSAPVYNAGPGPVYSLSQQIYTNEEIGFSGTIESIAFNQAAGNNNVRDIVVYMQNVDKEYYTENKEWIEFSDSDIVYQGEVNFGMIGDWITITLQNDFEYAGGNLAVTVYDKTGTGYGYDYSICDKFYSSQINETRGKYYTKNAELDFSQLSTFYGTPMNTGNWGTPANVNFINNIKLVIITSGETPEPVGNYRLESIIAADSWKNVHYYYDSENTLVKTLGDVANFDQGWSVEAKLLEYDANGLLSGYTKGYVYSYDDATVDQSSEYTTVTYTYNNEGVLASYTETINYTWQDPQTTTYTFSYNEDGTVAEKTWTNAKETYEYENGRLVKLTKSYYDQYASTPGYATEYFNEYEYDANGNCIKETKYTTYGDEPTAQNGIEYFHDATIGYAAVYNFAFPHEVLPAHANLITKTLSYEYREDWETGEISKDYFKVNTYNYTPEVAAAPFAPMDLVATVKSDTQIDLSWTSIETAESFNVYCNGELVGNSTETSYTVENLTAATDYCFTVKGVNSGAESDASNEACATTMELVNIVPGEIAFGNARLGGDYWSENTSAISVVINTLGKTITSVTSSNDFFRIPATIDVTSDPISFTVNYNKNAEAGEYTGDLVVTLSTGETVTAQMSATAYNPVTPDVFELAQEIEFVEGAYTDTPDFATLYDDYNLPNEAEGNNPDAVYAFTLDTESVVMVEVKGENAVYATYKAFNEEEGPTAANAFFGEETILKTEFSYDFENADLADFTIVNNDEFEETWMVENGELTSYSWIYDYENYVPYLTCADERITTKKAYPINANSVLTLDLNVNGTGGGTWGDYVTIEVTQDGTNFTQVAIASDDEYLYSHSMMAKRFEIGAMFAELGLEYGDYQISIYHKVANIGDKINIDNFALTERANVYTAGTYYLVAAASEAFEVNVEVAAQEIPVAPKAYRLLSAENHETLTYVYDEANVNRVVRIERGGSVEVLEYNEDGTLAGYKTTTTYEDPELGEVEEMIGNVSYVYEDGRIVSYTELVQSWQGPMEVETVVTYNAEGQVESVECADCETVSTFAYNAEGLVSEMATGYLFNGEAVADAKEVYTYENGKLVKLEYMAYDYFLDDGTFYVAEETVYVYDENGNCTKAETYMIELDEETEEEVRSLYKTVEYYYNTTVLAEDVYTFEYPHFAYTYPVKPATVNVLTKDMSFMTGYDFEGNYGNHSHVLTIYNYDPEILSAPYAPFNLAAEATGATTVALTWEAYADAETFVVYDGTEKVADGIKEYEYTVEGLAAGEHCFTVTAVNAAGESTVSNEVCVTIESAEPTVPAAPVVTAEVTEDATIMLSWNAVEGATYYTLYSEGAKVDSFTDTIVEIAVPEIGTYCFTVTATNEIGESEHSEEVCATVTIPEGMEVPAAPVVTAELDGKYAVLSWNAVEDALYYNVYFEDELLGNTQQLGAKIELDGPGTYCFSITAVNIAGESEHSEEVCVKYGDGIEENEVAFNIYPNPVENQLFIETESYVEEISIYTVTGVLVYSEADFRDNTIDVSDFDGGVYIMKVRTENGEIVKRFVKK